MTDKYAVIGHPVAHSWSPRIHAMFAAQTGEDIDYRALLAPLDGFAGSVAKFCQAGGRGANVTVPFKEEAGRLADRLSARAEAAGAVNTLAFDCQGTGIYGDNTDGAGLVRDICGNRGHAIAGRRVLLLGAGGAARGVTLPLLAERPRELLIANRDAMRAQRLAEQISRFALSGGFAPPRAGGLSELAGEEEFDIVINATSAGLKGEALPLPPRLLAPGGLAYDMVYGLETPFLRQARAGGAAEAVDGLGMLVEQAAESFALWRGVRPATDAVLAALRTP